ncbi:hypothetical protein GCM10010910_01120 [Microbacterium nanhaiense]|uniref:Uncharacterized protein n=1 Tax=Microbacterium nanhaiense TaxID=1301026 RepID=A0ABQ2MUJ9_9MICO|nr:hypothetical protein [Microbacterium nanhaiense]GGO59066.1 hypothetical protein GCM10010910_01120 [Microbacterium nanhaiense]
MTEQTNADIIAWLRRAHTFDLSPLGHEYTDAQIADALEAADQRAELAEANLSVEESKNAGYRAKNNQLAAVVEKSLAVVTDSDQGDSFLPLLTVLESAPADALREHDAALIDSLIEGIGSGTYTHQVGEGIEVALDQLHAAKAELREGKP